MKNINLFNTIITSKVLNEAEDTKYGLTDEILNGKNNVNPTSEMDAIPGDNEPDVDENGNDPTSVADEQNENGDQNSDGYTDEFSNNDMDQEGDMTDSNIIGDAQNTPGIRVLSTISDKEYKLNNLSQYDKFSKLIEKVNDILDNVIPTLKPTSPRLMQAKDIVHNNACSMVNDIEKYMRFNFSETYETNVVAYAVFMRRYRLIIDIIHKIETNDNK